MVKKRTIILDGDEQINVGLPTYQVEFGPGGEMYLFDTISSAFRVYDSTGVFLKSMGRMGNGPKEFMQVTAFSIDSAGHLYVYDDLQRLIKVFDKDFNPVITKEMNNTNYVVYSSNMAVYKNHLIVGVADMRVSFNRDDYKQQQIESSPVLWIPLDKFSEEKAFARYDAYLAGIASFYDRPRFAVDNYEGTLLLSYQNSCRFQEYNLETGAQIRYFGVKDKTYGEGLKAGTIGAERRQRMTENLEESDNQLVFYTTDYIGNFYINASESWADTKDLNDLNYFTAVYSRRDYEFLGVIPTDYRLIGIRNNQFYVIEDEDPLRFQVGVYEIHER